MAVNSIASRLPGLPAYAARAMSARKINFKTRPSLHAIGL